VSHVPKPSNPDIANGAATGDLFVGAEAISTAVFDGRLSRRQVYRLASEETDWPFVHVRGKIACRRSTIMAHIERLEAKTGA
jgi:hypothetical protein